MKRGICVCVCVREREIEREREDVMTALHVIVFMFLVLHYSYACFIDKFVDCVLGLGRLRKWWYFFVCHPPHPTPPFFFFFFSVAILVFNTTRNVFVFVKQFRPGQCSLWLIVISLLVFIMTVFRDVVSITSSTGYNLMYINLLSTSPLKICAHVKYNTVNCRWKFFFLQH